jgi:hypothetical protein
MTGNPSASNQAANQQEQQNQPQDANAIIAAILGQQSPDFTGNAASQVAGIYAPQYQAIDNMKSQATTKSAQADAALKAMYGALTGGINAQSGAIDNAYNTEKSGISGAYNTGQQAIGSNYANANNEVAGLMQKLGIQAAASDPRTLQQNANQGAFLQSILAANNQGAQNAANQEQKGAQTYNTEQANASNAAGTQNRWQNQQNLTNSLNSLNNQALQVQSAQAAAAQQLAGQYQSSWVSQQQALANLMAKSQSDQLDSQTKLEVAGLRYGTGNTAAQNSAYAQSSPMDKVYGIASKMYGADTNKASAAVNLVLSVDPNSIQNPLQFISKVISAKNQNTDPTVRSLSDGELQSLASEVFNQLKPQTQPSYGQGYDYGYQGQ